MRKKKRKKIMLLFLVFATSFFVFFYLIVKIRPAIKDMAMSKASAIAGQIVNKAVYDVCKKEDVDYKSLVQLVKDGEDELNAVVTDFVKVNELKSDISLEVLQAVSQDDRMTVYIPLGNIIDVELLSGIGPNLKFELVQSGKVDTQIKNVFCEAGINQTLHRIVVEINIKMVIISPVKNITCEYKTDVLIAETVIIGRVPEAYTAIMGASEEEVDILNDYIAQVD